MKSQLPNLLVGDVINLYPDYSFKSILKTALIAIGVVMTSATGVEIVLTGKKKEKI